MNGHDAPRFQSDKFHMANQRKTANKVAERKTRRTPNVELIDKERGALIRLWKDYHGGIRAFAKRMAEIENPDAAQSAAVDLTNTIAARKRALHRIEDGDTGVSEAIFKTIADVFEITTTELKTRLSTPIPNKAFSDLIGPWITDEKVLAEYRRVYHGYYITRQGTDYFWMYHQIDFSTPRKGCLHTTKNYGIDRPIYYKVYAYVFRQMLVIITQSDEEKNQLESVGIYHDFRRPIREHVGHFGIHLNEDWNSYFGVGGSMLLHQPLPGIEKEGRQNPEICKQLTEYWRNLDGERCNRLLHLFGFGPFSRSASVERKSGYAVPASKKRIRK
jgi:hypothetical protein